MMSAVRLTSKARQKILVRHGMLLAKYKALKARPVLGEEEQKLLKLMFASLNEIEELLDENQVPSQTGK